MKKIVDLNSFLYDALLTKDKLLEHVTQEDIYRFYIGVPINPPMRLSSPLRDDSVPSFSLFYDKRGSNALMYYDFATKQSGDCIKFVGEMFGLGRNDTIFKIAHDLNLSDIDIPVEKQVFITEKRKVQYGSTVKIGIRSRKWRLHDKQFWQSFGIKKNTLERYNVVPIDYIFYNGNPIKAEKHAYAYLEYKDGKVSYKIYQPFSKEFKWINNANYTVHQGYRQLPETGELLIITKSLKDVMSLLDVMDIQSVGLQSESVMMKHSVMDEYKNRFNEVICLFDNDAAGIKLANEFVEEYDISHISIPQISENVTDFSDMVKEIGIKESKKIFKKLLNEIRR